MEKAGIDRSAAQADKEISAADRKGTEGEAEYKNANKRHSLPQSYHVFIGNLHGKETADKTAEGDPEIKQRGPLCGFFRGYSFGEHKIAASPQSGRGFQGTIAKEAEQGWFGPGKLQHPGKGERSILCSVFLCSRAGLLFFPQRKRKEKKHGENDLNQGNGHIAAVPAFSRIQAQGHDKWPGGRADSPKAVKPAHVVRFIMQCHEVIQGGIHTSRSETVGNSKDTEKPGGMRQGEAKQSGGGHEYTYGGNRAGSQTAYDLFTEKTGNNGASGNNHGDDAGKRDGNLKLPVHNRPGGSQQGIGQTQADKGYVDNNQE